MGTEGDGVNAFECLSPCRRCKGNGTVGKGKRRRECFSCRGSGSCYEWRSEENPPTAPCRDPACCLCGEERCQETWCRKCFTSTKGLLVPNEGNMTWECTSGACPKCGSVYVEWLDSDLEDPRDVYLSREIRPRRKGEPPERRVPCGQLRKRRAKAVAPPQGGDPF